MKKLLAFIILCPFLFTTVAWSQVDSVLISDVTFKESKFNNAHAGSGFLIEYNGKMYACTAKHVLFFAKTENMKTISFGDELVSWQFVSGVHDEVKVPAGRLLNENAEEAISMPPKGDWLVFEVTEEIPKNVAVYSLRNTPLEKGEPVYFLGYPYNSDIPIKIKGSYFGKTENGSLRLDVPRGNYACSSGGPVLDKNHQLIGIVSMGYYDEAQSKMIFEPESLDYLRQVIQKHQQSLN